MVAGIFTRLSGWPGAVLGDVLGDAKARLDPKGILNPGVIVR